MGFPEPVSISMVAVGLSKNWLVPQKLFTDFLSLQQSGRRNERRLHVLATAGVQKTTPEVTNIIPGVNNVTE